MPVASATTPKMGHANLIMALMIESAVLSPIFIAVGVRLREQLGCDKATAN